LAEASLTIKGEDFILVANVVFGEAEEITILGMGGGLL